MTRAEILADLKVMIGKGIEVSDGELYAWINDGYNQLVDEVLANNPDFFAKSSISSTVVGQNEYALPSDFEKMLMVSVQTVEHGEWDRFQPLNNVGYSDADGNDTYDMTNPKYYILGDNLVLDPTPSESVLNGLKIWYTYTPTELTLDSSVPAVPSRYHGLIKYWAYANYLDRDDEHVGAERMRQRFDVMVGKIKDNMFGVQVDAPKSVEIVTNLDMF